MYNDNEVTLVFSDNTYKETICGTFESANKNGILQTIRNIATQRGYKIYYFQYSFDKEEIMVDFGSHTEFFFVRGSEKAINVFVKALHGETTK